MRRTLALGLSTVVALAAPAPRLLAQPAGPSPI